MLRYKKSPFLVIYSQIGDFNYLKKGFPYFSIVLRYSTDTVSTWLDRGFLTSHFLYVRGPLHGRNTQSINLVYCFLHSHCIFINSYNQELYCNIL